jgi:uncharacterized membrane protein (UPF0127 family)
MKRTGTMQLGIAATAAVLLMSAAAVSATAAETGERPAIETVLVAGKLFELELAVAERDRTRGLMERTEIPHNGGMLFVFADDEVRHFWMYNTLIDLDIAYLDAEGTVTAVHTMRAEVPRQPMESQPAYEDRLARYSSRKPARYALEFRAGVLAWLGLKPGDRVLLDFDRLRKLADAAEREDGP